MNKTRLLLIGLAMTVTLAACSSSGSSASSSVRAADADVTLVAKDMKFDQPKLTVKAGAPFTLLFRNEDSMPHNVAIYGDSSARTPLFTGDMVTSSDKVYNIPALKAGTYFFHCDLHTDMTGSIVAS